MRRWFVLVGALAAFGVEATEKCGPDANEALHQMFLVPPYVFNNSSTPKAIAIGARFEHNQHFIAWARRMEDAARAKARALLDSAKEPGISVEERNRRFLKVQLPGFEAQWYREMRERAEGFGLHESWIHDDSVWQEERHYRSGLE